MIDRMIGAVALLVGLCVLLGPPLYILGNVYRQELGWFG